MKRTLALALALSTAACSARTSVTPARVAPYELTLRYDDGLEVFAGKKRLTDAPGFDGLGAYVRCVPQAAEHADDAEDATPRYAERNVAQRMNASPRCAEIDVEIANLLDSSNKAWLISLYNLHHPSSLKSRISLFVESRPSLCAELPWSVIGEYCTD